MWSKERDGEPLSTRSQYVRVVPIRDWFKWLARQNHILYNPAKMERTAQSGLLDESQS